MESLDVTVLQAHLPKVVETAAKVFKLTGVTTEVNREQVLNSAALLSKL